MKSFAEKLFSHCPLLQPLQDECGVLFDDFNTYRYQIPVCGCIMLNKDMTKVVLVRNWKGTNWSFPKGKINEGESPYDCAIRETFEETGFNPTEYCYEEHFLVVHEEKKVTRLFLAVGVPESTIFNTQTRKEISKVEFHPLDQLPKKAWGVHPFLEKLERWIRRHPKLAQNHSDIPTPSLTVTASTGGQNKGAPKKRVSTPSRFDERNDDTFGNGTNGGGVGESLTDAGWSVQDMFAVNSKLTGQTYSYDGNPHNFGNRHPQYVNYQSLDRPPSVTHSNNKVKSESVLEVSLINEKQIPDKRQEMKMMTKTQALFTQLEAYSHPVETRQYFPSPFVFETKKILQKVDAALGLPTQSKGRDK